MNPGIQDPNTQSAPNTAETARPLGTKKRKHRAKRHKAVTTSTALPTSEPPGLCLLSQLPLELLAEILINTCSPKDVLAVARTSKYFCDTLLSSPSTFIWRNTRQACLPKPLPDPMSTFTESSYASFLFDGGLCEVCNAPTDSMYKSFAIKLRLCDKKECATKFYTMTAVPALSDFDHAIAKLVPSVESNEPLKLNFMVNSTRQLFRGIDWVREASQYSSISPEEILNTNAAKTKYISALMKFSKNLREWEVSRSQHYLLVKAVNEGFGKVIAGKYGWNYWDMVNCTPYGDLHRHKSRTLQYVDYFDYDQLAPTIADILLRVEEKRQRQAKEAAYKENRIGVAQHYNRLRSKAPPLTLPTLPTFRRLPIVAMVQSSDSTSPSAASTLKGPSWVQERLDVELKAWLDKAKGSLGAVLGHQNWKSASKAVLHPADRITARFLCKYCGRLALRYREDECLDFAGACSHECRTSKRQKQRDETWDAERFVKDDKAIKAMLKLAALCGADPTRGGCQDTINRTAIWVHCLSCSPGIIMCSKSVVGHSHRHDDMEMSLITEAEAQAVLASYPFKYGIAQHLLETYSTTVKLRASKNYGCRFCLAANRIRDKERAQEPDSPSRGAEPTHSDADSTKEVKGHIKQVKPYKRSYTFDGMRSHLKAAHSIENIRSEDFFCYKPLDWSPPTPRQRPASSWNDWT